MMKNKKTSEVVLITGASSGIGLATAELMATHGYSVFGTTRSLERNRTLVSDLNLKHSGRLQFIEMDVTQSDSVRQGVDEVMKQTGRIDVLICNAGIGIFGSIEETPLETVHELFEINYFGYLRTIQAVLPFMRESQKGRIVLVGSIAGRVAIPFQSHYSSTKYAIEALTEGLRQELHQTKIKVSAIRPGDIQTRFNEVTLKHSHAKPAYSALTDQCWEAIEENMKIAPKPMLVAKTIIRILKKKNQKTFYTAADFFTSFVPFLDCILPSTIKEKLVRVFYHVDRIRKQ